MLRRIRGQSALEYTVLIILVLGAFVGVGNYFKRGMQGRWKAAVDDLGDQYDPRYTNSSVRQTLLTNSRTNLVSINVIGGFHTMRTDRANTIELKTGGMSIGPY